MKIATSIKSIESKPKSFLGIIIRTSIGIILVVLLIWNISTEKLIHSFVQLSLNNFLFAICYQYASILLGAFNQYILFKVFSDLSWRSFVSLYFKAYILGLLLPGRFGDASIGFFLKKKGLDYSQSFSAFILDKYLTFILYLAILLLFVSNIVGHSTFLSLLLWALIVFALPIIVYLIVRFTNFLPITWRESRLSRFIHNLTSQTLYFGKHHPLVLLLNFSLTCLKLGLVILCYHAMMASLGYDLSTWKVGQAALASGIVAFIPVSIQGLGTVEAAALFNFKTLGVSSSDVLACYLLLRTSTYLFACFAYGATFLLENHKNRKGMKFG